MKYDIINVVDLEATCWENKEQRGISEIIELGISTLEVSTGKITSSHSIYVYPENSKVSEFCYNLTGIDQRTLDDEAISFTKVCDILQRQYQSKQCVWASYGRYDKRMFEDQCSRENINYPFGNKHINVKTLFALKYKLNKEVGMAEALKIASLKLEGRHHSGKDDAYNIAKILREILK